MDLHERLEHEFIEMIGAAGIPAPDDTARMQRALIFLWYDTKAFVLIDLDDMPADDPFAGFDLEMLRDDVLGGVEPISGLRPGLPPFFAEAG
ncbi:MAG TPA: hypothetical protein VH247_03625 [Thermoleophilaceae bacterium]|jgi:hypothetical protein|nr:hypothetical protein [Thermoleophilaceae bacterium]